MSVEAYNFSPLENADRPSEPALVETSYLYTNEDNANLPVHNKEPNEKVSPINTETIQPHEQLVEVESSQPLVLPSDKLSLHPKEYLPFAREAFRQMFLYRPPKEPLEKTLRRRAAIVIRSGLFWFGLVTNPLVGSAVGLLSYLGVYFPYAHRNYLNIFKFFKEEAEVALDSGKAIGIGIKEHIKNKKSKENDGFTLLQEIVWQFSAIRGERSKIEDAKNAKKFEKSHKHQLDEYEKLFPREQFPGATREALVRMLRGNEYIQENRATVEELQRRFPQETKQQIMERLEEENKARRLSIKKETILKTLGIYASSSTFFTLSMLALLHLLPLAAAGFVAGLSFSFAARVVMPRVIEGIKMARKIYIKKHLEQKENLLAI